jgi:hypothetical protein
MARSSLFLALLAALAAALLLAHARVASADALTDAMARVNQCVPRPPPAAAAQCDVTRRGVWHAARGARACVLSWHHRRPPRSSACASNASPGRVWLWRFLPRLI